MLATAACVCGSDENKIRRAPDTSGMKNEVIFQKSHRFGYDHAIRNVGVKIVEVETAQELDSAVNDRTAMLFFLNSADPKDRSSVRSLPRSLERKASRASLMPLPTFHRQRISAPISRWVMTWSHLAEEKAFAGRSVPDFSSAARI